MFRRRIAFIIITGITIWVFLWYNHGLLKQLNQTNKKACENIAWLWAGIQYPLSIVGDESGIMSCSACGYPEMRLDPSLEKDSLFCPVCKETTNFIHTARFLPQERQEAIGFTRKLFGNLVTRLDFPTIFADEHNYPQIVNGKIIDTFSPNEVADFQTEMQLLAEKNVPIPIYIKGDTIGHLFYGISPLSTEMRLMPFLELALLFFIAVAVFLFLRGEAAREEDLSWVGFARETAHQISTPLSSIMGWIELLKDDRELAAIPDLSDALDHIGNDVNRLNSIAQRYGQMGRLPKLIPVNIEKIVSSIVDYFNMRKGLLGRDMILEFENSTDEHIVNGNPVLIGWVLENLIKNAVASCASNPNGGRITISCTHTGPKNRDIEIKVSDNGRGIPNRNQKIIFKPGFTTRQGGWGLGLSLSRRIVEEYHNGTIRLLSSTPDVATIFSIILPLQDGGNNDNNTMGR